jgi:hypothetical protein
MGWVLDYIGAVVLVKEGLLARIHGALCGYMPQTEEDALGSRC